MPAARLMHRRRNARRTSRPQDGERPGADVVIRKQHLCDELVRIDAILARLRHRRRIGPDMSTDDLLDLFQEERERLFAQLRDVDAAVPENARDGNDPLQDAQIIEFRRRALASPDPVDFK